MHQSQLQVGYRALPVFIDWNPATASMASSARLSAARRSRRSRGPSTSAALESATPSDESRRRRTRTSKKSTSARSPGRYVSRTKTSRRCRFHFPGRPRQAQLPSDRSLGPPFDEHLVSHDMHLIHPEHPLSGRRIPRSGKPAVRPSGGLLSERRLAYFLTGAPTSDLERVLQYPVAKRSRPADPPESDPVGHETEAKSADGTAKTWLRH